MRWCFALVSVVLAAGRPDGGSSPLEIHWRGRMAEASRIRRRSAPWSARIMAI